MLFPREFVETYGTRFPAWKLDASLEYCRRLAGAHYENFHVASLLLPKRLHQDFFNVYAFCRWADDLGDEFGDPQRSLELLGWWQSELEAMYQGRTTHPVFVALAETVQRRRIPQQPFADLIRAFVQDQSIDRYQTYEQVLDYCVYSANPVGRLVLHLGGYVDEERVALSDFTCTALQLANHWQDLRRDFQDRNRIYLPQDVAEAHGYSIERLENELHAGHASPAFRPVMQDLVGRSRHLFEKGLPLIHKLDRRLALDVELFSRGGIAVLDKIRRQDYDVISVRPRIGKLERAAILIAVASKHLPRLIGVRN